MESQTSQTSAVVGDSGKKWERGARSPVADLCVHCRMIVARRQCDICHSDYHPCHQGIEVATDQGTRNMCERCLIKLATRAMVRFNAKG